MRYAYQVAAVRAAERALMDLVPEGALMQRAAAGLASACASLLARQPGHVYGARVVVLAGSGDNGGDALYAGALLARRGAAVTAIAPGPKAHDGGLTELRAAGGRVTDGGAGLSSWGDPSPQTPLGTGDPPGTPRLPGAADLIARADLIMDGLLGIGGHGGLREPFAGLARLTEQARQGGPGHEAGATVVAVAATATMISDAAAERSSAPRRVFGRSLTESGYC